jgi:hypothetical protein
MTVSEENSPDAPQLIDVIDDEVEGPSLCLPMLTRAT